MNDFEFNLGGGRVAVEGGDVGVDVNGFGLTFKTNDRKLRVFSGVEDSVHAIITTGNKLEIKNQFTPPDAMSVDMGQGSRVIIEAVAGMRGINLVNEIVGLE